LKLAGETVAVVISERGRDALKQAALQVPESAAILFSIEDSDGMGLWVRVEREDGLRFILLRWEYILLMDLPAREVRSAGLRM
jgi:hypothetical protein